MAPTQFSFTTIPALQALSEPRAPKVDFDYARQEQQAQSASRRKPEDPNSTPVGVTGEELARRLLTDSSRWHVVNTTLQDEIAAGQAAEAERRDQLYKGNPAVAEYVQGVMDRLAPSMNRPELKFRPVIIESDQIVAEGLPGGGVVLSTALLKGLKSEGELAAVLAHEMVHGARRHGLRKDIETKIVKSGALEKHGVSASDAKEAFLSNLRHYEQEADIRMVEAMAAAGFDPREAATVLQRLGDTRGHRHSEVEEGDSTHPSVYNRVKLIEGLSRARGYEGARELDRSGFKQWKGLLD